MKPISIFLISLLCCLSAHASSNSRVLCQSYEIPLSLWLKIPDSMRHNHQLLLDKVKVAAINGKAILANRSSVATTDEVRTKSNSFHEHIYPTDFNGGYPAVCPIGFETRHIGLKSEFRIFRHQHHYDIKQGLNSPWTPLISKGNRLSKLRQKSPRFMTSQLVGSIDLPRNLPVLLSALPTAQSSSKSVTLTFLTSFRTKSKLPTPSTVSTGTLEVLLIAAPSNQSKIAQETPLALSKEHKNTIQYTLVALGGIGQKNIHSSQAETIAPTRINTSSNGNISATALQCYNIGTCIQIQPFQTDDTNSLLIDYTFEHDIQPPVLPSKPGNNGNGKPAFKRFRITMADKATMQVNQWTFLKEVKAETITPTQKKSNLSYYLIGRVSARNQPH